MMDESGFYDYGAPEYVGLGEIPWDADSAWGDAYTSSNLVDSYWPQDPYASSQSIDSYWPQEAPASHWFTNESLGYPAGGTPAPVNVYPQGGSIAWGQMTPVNYTPPTAPQPASRSGGSSMAPSYMPASGRTQMPQINLGSPGGPVWDRLQAVMADPTKMTGDPAYQFLYNQGLQALNRSLAAQRLTHSGKGLTDTLNYGQGAAANYFNQLIPQLRGVAGDEYQRWAGPAGMNLQAYGLGQRDTANQMQATGMNNRLLADAEGSRMLSDLMPLLAGGGSSPAAAPTGGGIGWGGMSSTFNPTARLAQSWQQPTLNYQSTVDPWGGNNPYMMSQTVE